MDNLKNVIIVYDTGYIEGGAGKVAIHTALSLAEKTKLNIYYFCATGPVCDELLNSRVKCTCLNLLDINHREKTDTFFSGIFSRKVYSAFLNYLHGFSPEDTVIHIHGWTHSLSSAIFKAINISGIARIITLHEYFLVCPNGGFFNYKKGEICHYRPLSRKCIQCNCDKRNYIQKLWRVVRQKRQNRYIRKDENFIYLSPLSKAIIEQYYPKAHYYSYPNEIEPFSYHANPDTQGDAFLYLGRLAPEKGVEDFCQAVVKGNFHGIVIGDGELSNELKTKYPSIEFLGWMNKDQINSVLPRVKALVFPSRWYEVSPLTVPEMLHSGITCIVSDCNAAKDEITEGVNGYIYKAGDVEDLQQVMKKNMKLKSSYYSSKSMSVDYLVDAIYKKVM
jgi:glycosyltransferase involved in cell wall biosynthesis